MIEYEIQKSKKFILKKDRDIKLDKTEGSILNVSKYPEFSLILISTEATLYKIFSYGDFLLKKGPKYEYKEKYALSKSSKRKNSFLSELIFEINPYNDDRYTMAIGIREIVIVVVFSKRPSYIHINHKEQCKCNFIQWENELLICAFENKIIKIIKNSDVLNTFIENDYITAMKIIHYQDYKLLITGYNRKVIIKNFYSILSVDKEFESYIISKLEGKIDLIEYYNQYIIFCSKKNNIIYCYHFMNNNWKPIFLFEINKFENLEEDQEIINVNFILNKGIIVSFKNKIYIYYIKKNTYELHLRIRYDDDIYFCTVIYNEKYYYYYLIVAFKDKIETIIIDEIKSLDCYKKDLEQNKENICTCINTILNRKNPFVIKRIDDYILQAEMDNIFIKIEFNARDISTCISILKCEDYRLREILEEELKKLNNFEEEKEENSESLTEKLINLNNIIKSYYTPENDSYEDLGNFDSIKEIDKLKIKKEAYLEYYNILNNWQGIMKKKTPINNLYKEDEDFDISNKIMSSNLRELVNWDFSFDKLNIDKVIDLVNSTSNFYPSKDSLQKFNPFYIVLPNKKDRRINRKKSISTTGNSVIKKEKQKLNDSYELNIEENNNIELLNDEKKYTNNKLTKETFGTYLKKINKNLKYYNDNENISMLLQILNLIKYYTKEIINQSSSNLVGLYTMNLLDIFTLLESYLNFEFLFICILPISSIIYEEIGKDIKRKENQKFNKFKPRDFAPEKRINSENSLKPSNNISGISSDSNDEVNDDDDDDSQNFNDLILNTEETKNNSITEYYNEYKNMADLNNPNNFFNKKKHSKNSVDLKRISKINQKLRSNISFLSLTNKNEKNLIEILGSNFCNIIIDYVIFFSEELKILDNDSDENNSFDFFKLVNKYYEITIIKEINEIKKII